MHRIVIVLSLIILGGSPLCVHAQLRLLLQDAPRIVAYEETSGGMLALAGWFDESIDLEPGPGNTVLEPVGERDGFLAVYNIEGALQLALPIHCVTSTDRVEVKGLGYRPGGGYWLVGTLKGSADFDPGSGEYVLSSTPDKESGFIARYTATGLLESAFSFANATAASAIDKFVVAPNGMAYLTGYAYDPIDVQPGPDTLMFFPIGFRRYFVVGYTPDGYAAFVHLLGNAPFYGAATELAVDFSGGVALMYADWEDGVPPKAPYPNFAHVDSDGTFTNQFSLSTSVGVSSITIGENGHLLVAGLLDGSTDVDPGPDTYILDGGMGTSAFLVDYELDYSVAYGVAFGGDSKILVPTDRGVDVRTDDDGSSYFVARIIGEADIDPGPNEVLVGIPALPGEKPGIPSAVVAKYSSSGDLDYGFSLGTETDFVYVQTLRFNENLGIFTIFGTFGGTIDLDPGPGVYEIVGSDAFFAASYDAETGAFPIVTASETPRPSNPTISVNPNPFGVNGAAVLTPEASGHLRMELLDLLGRILGTLFDGRVTAGSLLRVPFEGLTFAPGSYILKVIGPDGVATRLVTKAY